MGKVVDLEAGKRRRTKAAPKRRRSKTALVLGGGGFTGGVYEIGALRALDLLSVNRTVNQFDVYVGASAGAFVAAMAANGVTPEEIRVGDAQALGGLRQAAPRLRAPPHRDLGDARAQVVKHFSAEKERTRAWRKILEQTTGTPLRQSAGG